MKARILSVNDMNDPNIGLADGQVVVGVVIEISHGQRQAKPLNGRGAQSRRRPDLIAWSQGYCVAVKHLEPGSRAPLNPMI